MYTFGFFLKKKPNYPNNLCSLCPHEYIEDSTDFSIQTQFLQLKRINSSKKIHTKINIFHTLALKIMKQNLVNLSCQELSNSMTNAPKFQYIFSVLILIHFD
jgi:hypothetical protein